MLERLGVNTRDQEAKLETKDVAAVMVTADLPAFVRGGNRIDIGVSGDRRRDRSDRAEPCWSHPLMGADGEVYAVAQGALVTNAFAAKGGRRQHHPQRAHRRPISPTGRIVEREVQFNFGDRIGPASVAAQPGFSRPPAASKQAINEALGAGVARATDPALGGSPCRCQRGGT